MKKDKDTKIKPKRIKRSQMIDLSDSKINKKLNHTSTAELDQIRMINIAFNIVHKRMRDKIEQWMNTEFENKLNQIVQKFVESEFKNEILPVLIQHINKKIENDRVVTKQQVKECIREIMQDVINKIKEEGL